MRKTLKRNYKEAFRKFCFTSVNKNCIEKPQCVICCKVLTQKGMKSSKLKQHFESRHGELVGKSVDYFRLKLELKNRRLNFGGMWAQKTKQHCRRRIALQIAREKKPHRIREELIQPCLIQATTLELGEEKANN